jgi:hypothetical protein
MRKTVTTLLAAIAVTFGLAATTGVAFAGDNNGIGTGGGDAHNHAGRGLLGGGLLGGVLHGDGGTCNGVTLASTCRGPRTNNYVGATGYPGYSYGYPVLVDGDQLNLAEYGYPGTVDVCNYPTYNTFETFAAPRLGHRYGDFRNRLGRDRGAWDTSWTRLRDEGCQPTQIVEEQPALYNVTQEPSETKLSNPGDQVTRPSQPDVDTGDGSTVK